MHKINLGSMYILYFSCSQPSSWVEVSQLMKTQIILLYVMTVLLEMLVILLLLHVAISITQIIL